MASKPFLRTLLERTDVWTALPLEPMADEEACALIASRMSDAAGISDAEQRAIARDAGGNPFLLEQLADYVSASDLPGVRPATFVQMLDTRVRALPAGGRRFLETLAICGRPVAPRVVFQACGLSGDERPLVAMLRAGRLLRSSGSAQRVEPYHDRIRETLTAAVSADDAREIHRLMARTLVACGADDPEALYGHYRGAGDPERAATQAALAAAKADEALAFDRAATFYRAALSLAPDAAQRWTWTEGLAGALANGGRPREAADVFLDAASAAPAPRRVELQRRAAEQMLLGGSIDRGLEVIALVLRDVGARLAAGPRQALASLVLQRARLRWRGLAFVARGRHHIPADDLLRLDTYWSVTTGLLLVDPVRAAEFHTRHLRLALDAGEPYRIARGIAVEAALSSLGGGPGSRRTTALIDRTQALAEHVGHPHALAWAALAAGTAAYLVGHWTKAATLCDRALTLLRERCVGVTWELNCAQNLLLGSLMYQGRLREVSSRYPVLLADAREHGNLYIETELRSRMTYVCLAADDPDGGERQADDIMTRWSHRRFDRQRYNHVLSRLQYELYRGRARPAWQLIARNWAAIRRSRLLRVQSFRIEASYVRARCALLMAAGGGDRRRFLSLARDAVRRIERERMPWSDPLALLVNAAIAFLEGHTSLAERRLAGAVDGFERADMQLHAAAARRRRGALIGGDTGRQLMREAETWMAAEGIRNPVCMTRLLAPGFPDRDAAS
jgi:hypothetical protein